MATGTIKGRTETLAAPSIQYNVNASYCVKKDGIVTLRLRVEPTKDENPGVILFSISEEYRPRYPVYFLGYQSPGVVIFELSSNGNITAVSALRANAWCSATITYVQ